MNTTLSWRLPTRTFGVAIDQDQCGGIDRAAIGVVIGFFLDSGSFAHLRLPPVTFYL
jgi:hypothetical protein